MSPQRSPVEATLLLPHTVAVGVDLVFCAAPAADFVESCEDRNASDANGWNGVFRCCMETHDPMPASSPGGCEGRLCREPRGCSVDSRAPGAGPRSSGKPSASGTGWLLQTGRNHVSLHSPFPQLKLDELELYWLNNITFCQLTPPPSPSRQPH